MSYADIAAYRAALARGNWFSVPTPNHGATTALMSLWRSSLPTPTNPTAAAVPDRLGLGAFGQPSGNWRLAKVRASAEAAGAVMVVDRLSHQGGLDGTVTTPQTTNLPTAALTRYTNGEGVMAGLEVHTLIGSTSALASMSYTNTTPTAGRVSDGAVIGTSSRNAVGVFVPLPLQAGDTGVRSVESVTLDISTGTVGAFGVVLYKPLTGLLPVNPATDNHVDFEYDLFLRTGDCPLVLDGACLMSLSIGTGVDSMVDVFLIPE